MTRVADKTVLVTGAGMGMGRLHVERAVDRGAKKVVLWDVNEKALEETADSLRSRCDSVHTYIVDVSDADAIESTASRVLDEVGPVHVLINNAGIVVPGNFLEQSHRDIDRVIRINTLGVMHVTRAFLPSMVEQSEAHLVTISSASALMALPGGAVYASSKWAAYGWSESIRLELELSNQSHVRVTTVCPSFVATGMFDGARPPSLTRFLTPDEIVDAVWRGIERNKILVFAPFMTRSILGLRGLLPTRAFDFVARHIFGVYGAMRQLKGRGPAAEAAPKAPEKETMTVGN